MKKKKKNIKKKSQITLRNYIQTSKRKGKKKDLLGMLVFSTKILVSKHILYSNLEIHDDFRTTGIASFNTLSQIIKK